MSLMAQVRRERLAQLTSWPEGTGLEIGPLAAPIVPRAERDVRYVDVFDQAALRERYHDDPSVPCEDIPVIDFALTTGDGVVTLAEAAKEAAPYSYVVACHVIEHVPDVVAWLRDIAALLADDGLLVLVVPDKRHCFDYYREQTSVGQMLHAAEDGDLTPSLRAVYDHFRTMVTVSSVDTWRGRPPDELSRARVYTLEETLAEVQRARSGQYVDCHVWTFTPEVFVEQLTELAVLGLSDFVIEALLPTPEEALEFYVVLRRIDPAADDESRRALVERSREQARAMLESAAQPFDPVLEAERERARALEAQQAQLGAELAAVRAGLAQANEELARIRQSERWRIGGAVVAPVARVRQRWRRSRRGPADAGS